MSNPSQMLLEKFMRENLPVKLISPQQVMAQKMIPQKAVP
jgi:hypothetical protein